MRTLLGPVDTKCVVYPLDYPAPMVFACPLLSLLPRLRHSCVRDLCWVLSPQTDLLLSLPPYERFSFRAGAQLQCDWITALDNTPQPLLNHLAASSTANRLGYYFETLLQFYFLHCPHEPLELVAHNLPLYNLQSHEKKTLGELDFLLQQLQQKIHLEVAVKFYLSHQGDNGVEFLGPNARDSWDRKLLHMENHQLPMARRRDVCHELLPPDKSLFLVKGCLFSHWRTSAVAAKNTHKAVVKNRWLHFCELDEFLTQSKDQWHRIDKMQWLGGDAPIESAGSDLAQLRPTRTENSRPFMLLNQNNNLFNRVMAVPDLWPQH